MVSLNIYNFKGSSFFDEFALHLSVVIVNADTEENIYARSELWLDLAWVESVVAVDMGLIDHWVEHLTSFGG